MQCSVQCRQTWKKRYNLKTKGCVKLFWISGKMQAKCSGVLVKACVILQLFHIVPCGKLHRIGGAPPETFPNVKYDAPEEVGGNRKCFGSPIKK